MKHFYLSAVLLCLVTVLSSCGFHLNPTDSEENKTRPSTCSSEYSDRPFRYGIIANRCKHCSGKGYIPEICCHCDGSGFVPPFQTRYYYHGSDSIGCVCNGSKPNSCGRCKGTEAVYRICGKCNGITVIDCPDC